MEEAQASISGTLLQLAAAGAVIFAVRKGLAGPGANEEEAETERVLQSLSDKYGKQDRIKEEEYNENVLQGLAQGEVELGKSVSPGLPHFHQRSNDCMHQEPPLGPHWQPEIQALKSLDDLLHYTTGSNSSLAFITPAKYHPYKAKHRTNGLMVCHDFAGGYAQDRFVQGGTYDKAYRIYDWLLIDTFIYFSHSFVTIPPAGWIQVAHLHGTRVLGTVIFEPQSTALCRDILADPMLTVKVAEQLVTIAIDHGFEGWLLNFECNVEGSTEMESLMLFLEMLHSGMKAVEGGMVVWYDSLTKDGQLDYQNMLNHRNKPFFDRCSSLFTNYGWGSTAPFRSAVAAQHRRHDVYMGIDVWGRGSSAPVAGDVKAAFTKVGHAGVSAALFAPAWTMESQCTDGGGFPCEEKCWQDVEEEFEGKNSGFWDIIRTSWRAPRELTQLPLVCNYNRGVGQKFWVCGKEVLQLRGGGSPHLVYDLSSQAIEPVGRCLSSKALLAVKHVFTKAFDGQGCLCISGLVPSGSSQAVLLHSFSLPVPNVLQVNVTTCVEPGSGMQLALTLAGSDGRKTVVLRDSGEKQGGRKSSKRLVLSESHSAYAPIRVVSHVDVRKGTQSESMSEAVKRLRGEGLSYGEVAEHLKGRAGADAAVLGWCTRSYVLPHLLEQGQVLESVQAHCISHAKGSITGGSLTGSSAAPFRGYIGELSIAAYPGGAQPKPSCCNLRAEDICWAKPSLSCTLAWDWTDDAECNPAKLLHCDIWAVWEGQMYFIGRARGGKYRVCSLQLVEQEQEQNIAPPAAFQEHNPAKDVLQAPRPPVNQSTGARGAADATGANQAVRFVVQRVSPLGVRQDVAEAPQLHLTLVE
ncbi:unnamed protein product [Chrysoparadoxa australica]